MKTTILLIVLNCFTIFCQWSQDIRLTNASGNSITPLNNSKCIAANGDTIHIVWYDDRDGNEEIYYKRSMNNGASWDPDVRLTNSTGLSNYPAIFVSGLNVRIAWRDYRDGNYEEYYKQSNNGGVSWGNDVRLTNAQSTSSIPAIYISNNNEFIVWHDYRDDPNGDIEAEIYFKKSTDNGITWSNDFRLTNSVRMSENPSISVSNSTIHIVWADSRMGGGSEIFYKESTDNGNTWTTDLQISNNPPLMVSNNPCISSSGQNLFVVWNDHRNYHSQIYFKRSIDGGLSWSSEISISNDSSSSYNASLVNYNEQLHFVYYDNRDNYFKIYYEKSNDLGLTWLPELKLTHDNTAGSSRPSMCISNNQLNVIWCDTRFGNFEIFYKNNPGGLTNINTQNNLNVKAYLLSQNYPNPFNPKTKIRFDVPTTSFTKLIVYDLLGREVATLVNEELKPGSYEADWDASNFSSGVYFYKIISGDFVETKKMVLMK